MIIKKDWLYTFGKGTRLVFLRKIFSLNVTVKNELSSPMHILLTRMPANTSRRRPSQRLVINVIKIL